MKKTKVIAFLSVIFLCAAAYLFYSRPMTMQQRFPMLTLDKCTDLHGVYKSDGQADFTVFSFDSSSEEFAALWDLLYAQEYRRSLRDLVPEQTRIHPTGSGGFEWEIFFCFDDVALPDGTIGSGDMLCIQSWYGKLDIWFGDKRLSCYTDEQDPWASQILDIIHGY